MRLKCVIFDFDRTLVNLLDFTDWNSAREVVAKSYLKNKVPRDIVAKHDKGPFRLFYNVYYELAQTYPRNLLKKIQLDASKALEKFELEGALKSELMPECFDILKWIKNEGMKIGVVSTNSRRAIQVAVSRLNIADFIDVIVGRNPLPEKMKPYPHQVLTCLKKLACKPTEAVIVGDSRDDMQVAKRLNIFAIAVLTGRASKEELNRAGANQTIKNLSELQKLIPKLSHER